MLKPKWVKQVHKLKHEHDLFIKWVSYVNLNMTQIHLASTHDLFINRLVVSGSRVLLDFVIPSYYAHY